MERDYLDILREKERGDEEQFFRRRDAELLQKLRDRAELEEVTRALADKLHVDDPELLSRVVELGVTLATGPAFLLAPLLQIAWAEGKVAPDERAGILDIARERGIEDGSPAHAQLLEWMAQRPTPALFETAADCIRRGISVLPEPERQQRIQEMVTSCRRVAAVHGGSKLARLLGLDHGVSHEEEIVLAAITAKLTL